MSPPREGRPRRLTNKSLSFSESFWRKTDLLHVSKYSTFQSFQPKLESLIGTVSDKLVTDHSIVAFTRFCSDLLWLWRIRKSSEENIANVYLRLSLNRYR